MDFLPEHNNIPDLKKQEQEKQKNIEEIILRYLSGWAIHIIASSSTGNRTPVSAVRGRRLNRLTIEPYLILNYRLHRQPTYQYDILTYHTNISSSTGNRTPVSAVRGRRLNRLTIEPYLILNYRLHRQPTYQYDILTYHTNISSSTGNRTPVSAVRGRRLNRLTIEPYRTLLQYTLALTKKQAFFCILFKLFNLCIFYIVFRQFNFGTRGQTPVPAHGTGV